MEKIIIKPTVDIFKWFFTRAMLFYVGMFLLSHVMIDYDKIKFGIGVRQLNFLMPESYDYLLNIEKQAVRPDKQTLLRYIDFYKKVLYLFPKRSDAYGMLGFCYYYLGDMNASIQAFEKAHSQMPEYFWYSYNLGAIYYNLKIYPKAEEFFRRAINYDLNITYTYLLSSKEILKPILKSFDNPEVEAENRLLEGFKFAQELTGLLNQPNAKRPVSLPSQLVIRIF